MSNNPSESADAREIVEDIMNAITPDEFKKSLVNKLVSLADLREGSKYIPLEQFGKMPRKYFTVNK